MKRLFLNPGAGLLWNTQVWYWLSLLLFVVLVVASFVAFGAQINSALAKLNTNLQNDLISRSATAFVLAGLLAFDILLPVPSSMVALVAVTALGVVAGSAVIFVGLCLGAVLGYFLGAGYFHIFEKRLKPGERQRATRFSTKLTPYALVLLRGVPVLAETSVLAAGMSRYSFRRFLLITTLANAGLATAYGYIGSNLALQNSLLMAILACMVLPGLLFVIHLLLDRFGIFAQRGTPG